eukprot:CAMPEP_0113415136 /NCGR_PEP_ID=MMETSP0013_2-20120614/24403_1 /TAXON_ID=2843 ORGANISM="Skeletonema costatum, Strain 1716" /NCGR_SAMPLE_ID=MMETSP0013_2 /ASSEMBLY_ACC=CAM_ASM_000158 /LENGTH=114 /DNA_ID=CAMNT_0000302067 /DNA_START=60 /DNA_END=404 /DNA_ORIENTATION=+ /assembly_acc=CAM_ASM_000158
MNHHLLTSVALVIVAIFATTLPSASGFALLSPLLLRVNPAGVAARMNKSSSSPAITITDSLPIVSSSKASEKTPASTSRPPSASVDFGLDEDMMRYKHELLSVVYERSLTRGFE